MKVLSLFDGISCGMVALERANIKVDMYLASEIKPSAIACSKANYPPNYTYRRHQQSALLERHPLHRKRGF